MPCGEARAAPHRAASNPYQPALGPAYHAPAMQRLRIYVLRQMAVAAAMTVAGLTLAIWLSQSLRLLDVIVNRGLSVGLALKFLMLLLPGLIALLLPVAVFIAVMFVYHRLNADSEMVIIRTAGVSDLALAQPALAFGLLMSVLAYGLTLYAIPGSMRDYHDIQEEVAGNLASVLIEAGVFTEVAQGVTFFAHSRDRNGGLGGIIVDDSRDRTRRLIYTAERGAILGGPGGPRAVLQRGTYQETDRKTGQVSVLYFDQTEVGLGGFFGRSTGPRPRQIEELYLDQLLSGSAAADAPTRAQHLAEAHRRIAEPLYSLVMAMIAAACLITSGLPRQGQNRQMMAATAGAAAFLSLSFVLRSVTQRLPALAPIVYLLPTVPLLICFWQLARRRMMQPRPAA
jgi:lipopolysaccharide export system permease protein